MARTNVNDLIAFVTVARERSFTRAAAQLGVSPSALSHAMRGLEERLGVRLLSRTTRSVAPTEAGEQMLQRVAPHLDAIGEELGVLGELRDKPAGIPASAPFLSSNASPCSMSRSARGFGPALPPIPRRSPTARSCRSPKR